MLNVLKHTKCDPMC